MALMSSPDRCYTWAPPLEHQLKEREGPSGSGLIGGNWTSFKTIFQVLGLCMLGLALGPVWQTHWLSPTL